MKARYNRWFPLLLALAAWLAPAAAQEAPYFVTYDHHLEDPGDLEVSLSNTVGVPRVGQSAYWAPFGEFGYGLTSWWSAELYLEGQTRSGDHALFTGWRLENRFRPLAGEHRLNPILYFEFEDINEGSRIQKEVVGHSLDFDEPNDVLGRERARELETKFILSSSVRRWNVSENFIVEKNLSENEGFEFGYALGVSRPLSDRAWDARCRFCRAAWAAGAELYGGLGTSQGFGFHDTAHYLAPVLSWRIGEHVALHFSPGFGLTGGSSPVLLRFGYSYEIEDFKDKVVSLFRRKP